MCQFFTTFSEVSCWNLSGTWFARHRVIVSGLVSHAVILAHRLDFDEGTAISPVAIAMIRSQLATLAEVGVRRVAIVDGEHAQALEERIGLEEFQSLSISIVANRSWRRASGAALRMADSFLRTASGACLVLRGDRPLDTATLRTLAEVPVAHHAAAILMALPPADSDLSSEVKAKVLHGQVHELGLDLDVFDGVFTGHCVVGAGILSTLDGHLNPGLEHGLNALTSQGGVKAVNSGNWPWPTRHPIEVGDQVAAILETKKQRRYTLMNPGPVNTTTRVKSAMIHHDVSHRDSGFSELLVSLTDKLRRIFRGSPGHTVAMVTGSGTAAMECALASTVPRDRKVLVVDNGAFGERMLEICRLHEMDVVHVRYAWGDEVNPRDIERAFNEHPDIAVVAMIHHETSVGLLNPVQKVGEICRRYDAVFVVDAVSSLGAEEIDVVRDHIDVCYGSANKCLHAISGTGFLCVAPRVWQRIENVKPRSYYLNLKRYRDYMHERAQTPFTPAVSSYFALDAACAEFLEDGATRRLADYRRQNELLRSGLAELGMVPFTRTGRESHSMVTCCVPRGLSFDELYNGLKKRGFIVYACKDVLADKFVQVSNMGDTDDDTIKRFLQVTAEVIHEVRAANTSVLGGHAGDLGLASA